MKINPIYQPFFDTQKRYVILYGSAGSGKSHVAAQKLLLRALDEPNVEQGEYLRRSIFHTIVGIASGLKNTG